VAFGDNETFNVLDIKSALDVERYARIDVDAVAAEYLYPDRSLLLAEKNLNFLRRCVQTFHWVNFADQASGRVYLRIERGKPVQVDGAALRAAALQPDTLAVIQSVAPEALQGAVPDLQHADFLEAQDGGGPPSLGQWGRLT
jgi:ABC-type microcin C transport system permease subunit YejE